MALNLNSIPARCWRALLLLLILGGARPMFAATVTTDRSDYTPGMTVLITGAGWQPNETVTIHLDEVPDACPMEHDLIATADAFGTFTDASFTLDVIHIGVVFTVQATGELSGFTASTAFTDAAANLDQARNGPASSPDNPVAWVNGNVNSSQAHMVEGFSVPYRMLLTGLSTGSHTLVIEWDITASGGQHSIDYITHYDRLLPHNQFGAHTTPEVVNPTNGIAGTLAGPTTFPIPAPSSAGSPMPGEPTASFNALPAGERVLSIWNGTITSAVYLAQGNLAAANEETSMEIKFVTTNSTVIIAWGGHIATKMDWGEGNSATGVSGSPYHTRLVSFDGGGGNQDRSLQAGAVISPPSCPITGPTNVCAGTTNSFFVSSDIGTNFVWSITNNTSGAFIVGPTNQTNVMVASGTGGSFVLQIFVSSNLLSSVCTQLVIVASNTSSVGPTNVAICSPADVTFTTIPSGTGPFTFVWRRNGMVIPGATSNSITVTNASTSAVYCVEVTGACNAVTNCATLNVDTPPSITCPSNISVQCYADVPPPNTNSVSATPGAKVTHEGDVAVTNGCEIVITRTYKAVNSCSNMASCTQTITVHDTIPPVLTCGANHTVECGSPWDFSVPTATDNCLGTNVVVSIVSTTTNTTGFCGNTFSATRTWEALDGCTNRSTCSQTITIVDTTAPTITCAADRTVECGTGWSFDAPSATDLCGGTNVTIQIISTTTNTDGFCGNTFSATRTWEATDACTNRARCSQTITIVDTTAPTITCAADRTVECGTGWSFDAPTASDLCGGTNVTIQIISTTTNTDGFCGNTFSATRTWEATDACTNRARCSQTITIVDTTAPTITCAADRTVECGTGWSFDAPTASDLCGGTNVTIQIISTTTNTDGFCGNTFSATRTWEATDACTNRARCSQTITIVDTTAPTITCAADRTVECGTGWSFDAPSATDLCGGTNVTIQIISTTTNTDGFCGNTFSATRTWEATDACTNRARCSQTITIVDTTAPTITCAADRTVECGTGWSFDAPTATDLCGGTNVTIQIISTTTNTDGFCGNTFSATRTWEATDACTNRARCSQTITIVDTTAPTITCAADRTVECGTAWSFDAPSATDLCGGTNVTIQIIGTTTNTDGFCGNTFSATRTWEATDACTNRARCSQTITIVDTTAPTITCAADRTVECGTGWSFDAPSATDLCGGTNVTIQIISTTTNTDGFCGNTFSATRTWEATDACTNRARCSQTITIVDTTAPTITCAADRTVECGTGWSFDAPTATDLCGGTNVTIQIISTTTNTDGFCGNTFSATRTWEATDACTNRARCSQTITIVDTTAPTITCVADRTVECGTGWSFDAPSATDLCGGTNVTIQIISTTTNTDGFCGNTFSATRTWEATDACTNRARCSQTITIVDTTAPTITCAADRTVECGTGWSFDAPTASDLCGGTNVTIQIISTTTNTDGFCGNTFSATRTWEATDACTNRARCSQTITIVDTTAPTITCAADRTVECGTGWSFDAPTATDLCGGTNVTIQIISTTTNTDGFCGNTFSATRTWEATDACTNRARCSQTITIVDTTAPTITCAADRTVECGTAWSFDAPSATDLCGGTNVTIQIISTTTNTDGFCGNTFSATRTWEATDACTNRARCSQTITIVDTTAPTITCAADRTVECGTAWSFDAPSATDLCGGTNVTIQIISTTTNTDGFCGNTFSATRTWEATDACTNRARCSQTITIVDTTAPTITCAADRTVECGTGWSFDAPTASDLCGGTNVTIQIISTTTNTDGFCGNTFSATRTWEATDACTNRARCSQTITVVDTTLPTITCQPNRTNEWVTGAVPVFGTPTATDACDTNVTLTFVDSELSATCPAVRIFRRTWTATDDCTNRASCSQTITFIDTTPPVIVCPTNITVDCAQMDSGCTNGQYCSYSQGGWGSPPNGMNPGTILTNGFTTVYPGGFVEVGIPGAGGFSMRFNSATNIERYLPAMAMPKALTNDYLNPTDTESGVFGGQVLALQLNVDFSDAGVTPGMTNCSFGDLVLTDPASPLFGKTVRQILAIANLALGGGDVSGYGVTLGQLNTLADNLNNAFEGCHQSDWAHMNLMAPHSSSVPPSDTGTGTASDSCDPKPTVTYTDEVVGGSCLRTIYRTWVAVDVCGNSNSCVQIIRFQDTQPPMILCATNRFVECGQPWDFEEPTARDNCSGVIIAIVRTTTNGLCGATYSATRTWSATDQCGNSNTCSQTITIVDTMAPTISCATNRIIECGTPWNFDMPTAADICSGTNVTIQIVSTTTNTAEFCGNTFSATRTWEATDPCTNRARCSQTITIVDTGAPMITCVSNRTVECGTPWYFNAPTASDICNGTNVTVQILSTTTNTAGFCGNTFSATRTWEATDACTNRARCSQTITIVDTAAPMITCVSNRTVECGTPWYFNAPTATDVCNGTNVTIQIVGTTTNKLCGATFIATRTWSATDQCGNSNNCSQTVTVVDTMPPMLIGVPPNATYECLGDVPLPPLVTAMDSCDTNVHLVFVTTTNGFCPTQIIRTWTATDACSNSVSASQTNLVQANPPQIVSSPTNRIVCPGASVSFCVGVTTRCPIRFQWCKGSTILKGATNACLNLTNVSAAETGDYCVKITGEFCIPDRGPAIVQLEYLTELSVCARLDVLPLIALLPLRDTTNCPGETVRLCASLGGDGSFSTDFESGTPAGTALFGSAYIGNDGTGNNALHLTDPLNSSFGAIQIPDPFGGANVNYLSARWRSWVGGGTGADGYSFNWATDLPGTPNYGDPGEEGAGSGLSATVDTYDNLAGEAPGIEIKWMGTRVAFASVFTLRKNQFVDALLTVTPAGVATFTYDGVTISANLPGFTGIAGGSFQFGARTGALADNHWIDDVRIRPGPDCPITYTWTRNNQVLPGQTNSCLVLTNVMPANSGLYCVVARGCCNAVTNCARLTVPSTMLDVVCPKNKKANCDERWTFDSPKGTNVTILETVTNTICGQSYSATRTWLIGDPMCGSLICTQQVIVVPNLDIDCGHDKTVGCGETWSFDEPHVTSCSDDFDVDIVYTTSITLADGSVQYTRKWEVHDSCGNKDSCKQIVTVRTGTPAVVVCAPDKLVECGMSWDFDAPSAGDATVRVLGTSTNAGCGKTLTAARSWEVTDRCGNVARCAQIVTIVDTLAPVLLKCPTNVVVECGPLPPPAHVFAVDPASIGPGPQLVLSNQNIVGGSGSWPNTTWNDPASGFNTFRIVDNQAGPVSEPNPGNFWLGRDGHPAEHIVIDLGKPYLIDRIDLFNTHNTIFDDRRTKDFQISAGNAVTNADVNGLNLAGTVDLILSNRLTFQVAHEDPIEPDTFTADNGLAPCTAYRYIRFETLSGYASDRVGLNEIRIFARMLCDTNVPVLFTEVRTNGACPKNYTVTRTWTAADGCGNSNRCTQIITVQDTTPPVLTCLPDQDVSGVAQIPPCPGTLALFRAAGGEALDACDTNLVYACQDGPFLSEGCRGRVERLHSFIDSCGNSNACVQVFHIGGATAASPFQSLQRSAGESASFTTVASGSGPFTFTWRHDGAILPGQLGESLTIPIVTSGDAGLYSVEVAGPCDTVTNQATLTVTAAALLAERLISHWTLDEANGSIALDSVGSNHGTLVNDPLHSGGVMGRALSFDGTNDCVEILGNPSLNLSNRFSISLWFKPVRTLNAASGRRDLINKFLSYCIVLNAGTNDGRLAFALNNGAPVVKSTTTSWSSNQWTHIVATDDGANVKLYVNGVLEGTAAATASPNAVSNPLQFGGDPVQGGFYSGLLDDVRLYSTNLPPATITALFNRGTAFQGPSNLTLTVSFEAGRGTLRWTAVDGVRYRVEYKTDLAAPQWTTLPGDVIAVGTTASREDTLVGQARRFYRVVALP